MASCCGGVPSTACDAAGSLTGTPFTTVGSTTMKMISRTRQTSTSGVTLMFDSSELCERSCMRRLLHPLDTGMLRGETFRGGGTPPDRPAGTPALPSPRFDRAERAWRLHDALDRVAAALQHRAV